MSKEQQAMASRRDFLRLAAAGMALGAIGNLSFAERFKAQAQEAGGMERPNILVIMSDEHNAAIAGCYGNELAHTPNLDSLAANGITFDACYTASPLCAPARLAFTAGQYISHISAWNNNCWIPDPTVRTLPALLADAGYETVLCGKMHYDITQRYGFTVDMGLRNQGFMDGKGPSRRIAYDLAPKPGISGRFKDFRLGNKNTVMSGDMQVTARTISYLRNRKKDSRPFFMLAGYVAPHFPLIVPERYWAPYKDRVPMPYLPDGFLDTLPLNYKHLRIGFNMEDVPDNIVKFGRELYYGFVQWLDEQIGIVLNTLASSEVADNTIVIYTTDHGESMGEHGLWWKNTMYEQTARVPLIISWPRRWTGGQRRLEACSHLDLVATIAELAGVKAPAEWDGDSMVAWMDNSNIGWKDLAVSQYYAHNIASGYVMARQGKYKYVYHSPANPTYEAEHELYDLAADPGEFTNLAYRPEYRETRERLFATILQEIGEHPDETERRCRAETAKGYNRVKPKGVAIEED